MAKFNAKFLNFIPVKILLTFDCVHPALSLSLSLSQDKIYFYQTLLEKLLIFNEFIPLFNSSMV
jgi:hypothetical protein